MSKKEQEKKEQRNVRKGGTASEAMEKGGCVRVIKGEEVRGDDPVKYFLIAGE